MLGSAKLRPESRNYKLDPKGIQWVLHVQDCVDQIDPGTESEESTTDSGLCLEASFFDLEPYALVQHTSLMKIVAK